MTDLHRTEVDGVPTVWTHVPGPLRATLTVRVGSADETFVTSGISHLLEHLALFGLGRPGEHSNGFVDQTRSVFTVEGDGDEVATFLGSLTRQLSDPPVDRLDDERGVIAAEHARRGLGAMEAQLLWRYGATGYGLAGMEQLGVRRVSGNDLRDWSRRFATRANSVLWISGPPPRGLRLQLPDGIARPAPDPRRSILPWSPSWFTGGDDRVIFDAVLTRSMPAVALAEVLRGRLVDELRSRRAVAYSPDAGYLRLTRDAARLVASSDLVPGRQTEAVRPMLSMLERLSSEPDSTHAVQPGEIAAWLAQCQRARLDPQHGLGMLDGAAWDILNGDVPRSTEQELYEQGAVTGEQIAAAAREAQTTLLAQVPAGLAPMRSHWKQAPSSQEPLLSGREYRSRHRDERPPTSIRLGPEGISLVAEDEHLSVPLAGTVGVLRRDDGQRVLVGADGNQLNVEPTLWQNGPDLVAQLDRQWPSELALDLGSRPASAIPQPASGSHLPLRRRLFRRVPTGPLRALKRPAVSAGLTIGFSLLILVASAVHNHNTSGYYFPSIIPLAASIAVGLNAYRTWQTRPGRTRSD